MSRWWDNDYERSTGTVFHGAQESSDNEKYLVLTVFQENLLGQSRMEVLYFTSLYTSLRKWPGFERVVSNDICGCVIFLSVPQFEMTPTVSVNFISLVSCCVGLWEDEPQAVFPMSSTWVYHIAASVLTGC